MQDKMARILRESISEVFETMFFLCPAPLGPAGESGAREPPGKELIAQIETQEGGDCRVLLILPETLLRRISDNLLGPCERGRSRDELMDTAREVTNMVGGSVLSRLGTPHRRSLSIPRILSNVEVPAQGAVSYRAEVEGEVFSAYLWADA